MKLKTLLPLAFTLALAGPAHALIGGTVDSNTPSSPYAGVGAVISSGGTFSGVLIGSDYVLTAAHILSSDPGAISFRVNDGSNTVISASEVFILPQYMGTQPGPDGVWHDDLAIIKLSSSVNASVPVYDFFTGSLRSTLLNPVTFTMVGYGAGGNGTEGVTTPANPAIKRVGRNVTSRVYVDDDGGTADEVFEYTFNPGSLGLSDEAHFASGDSGSPIFVTVNGELQIAGIANYISAQTTAQLDNFGAEGGGTIVAPYISWILGVTQPVPEPETWASMVAGLGLVGFVAYRRRKA